MRKRQSEEAARSSVPQVVNPDQRVEELKPKYLNCVPANDWGFCLAGVWEVLFLALCFYYFRQIRNMIELETVAE